MDFKQFRVLLQIYDICNNYIVLWQNNIKIKICMEVT